MPRLRADAATLAANRKGQPGLWAFGISGDYPILLVRMDKSEDLALVQQALQAHAYWRNRHIQIDLVILNQQGTTYGQELRGQLQRVLVRQNSEDWLNRRGGIFTPVCRPVERGRPSAVGNRGARRARRDKGFAGPAIGGAATSNRIACRPLFQSGPIRSAEPTPLLARPSDLLFDNGLGGFSADGREYVIYLEPGRWTPAPWINVIANPDFGFMVSETGAGYTWSGNSGENRLTPWSNDPVTDPPGEALYLRDEETARGLVAHAAAVPRAGAVPDPPRRRVLDLRAQQPRARSALAALRRAGCAGQGRATAPGEHAGATRGGSPRRSMPNGCWA